MGNHFCVTVFLRVNFPVSPQLDGPQVDGLWRRKWQKASFELGARSDQVLGSFGIFPVGAVALGAVGRLPGSAEQKWGQGGNRAAVGDVLFRTPRSSTDTGW